MFVRYKHEFQPELFYRDEIPRMVPGNMSDLKIFQVYREFPLPIIKIVLEIETAQPVGRWYPLHWAIYYATF